MTEHADFFQAVKPAAVLKHAVLEGYVKVFTTMTGSTGSGTVWVVDAYAGPGEYAQDGDEPAVPGSPRIVCDLAESLAGSGRRLRGIFIEQKRTYAAQLRSVVGTSAEHVVYEGTAGDHLSNALALAGSDPVLLFLDPFGVSLPLDVLVTAVKARPRGAKTEILLNFNLEAVSRIGGILASTKRQPPHEKTLERADQFLGGTWWREEFLKACSDGDDATATEAAFTVAEGFRAEVLQRTGLRGIHVPIRRRAGAPPLFLLTLFTGYPKATYIFVDMASGANAKWRDFNRQKALAEDIEKHSNSLFGVDLFEEISAADHRDAEAALDAEWVRTIKENIAQLIDARAELVVATDIVEIYGTTVTLAREKHLRQAWDELSAEGLVAARDKPTKLRDQTIRRKLAVAVASGST